MTLEEISAIEAIRALKARYFRLVDTKQWDAWGDVFTPDVKVVIDGDVQTPGRTPPQEVLEGRDTFVGFARERLTGGVSVHHGHMPEIEVLSRTEARGVWAMEDIVERDGVSFHGHGHYHETYRNDGDAWRIASLRLTRLRRSVLPPAPRQ
ncbi:MAG: nuclear transport factor 2 family protein [Caulobacteraceae bacterium]|nr:nuclear transport factor 2 family protein [Caulobacteraceae bacterium]